MSKNLHYKRADQETEVALDRACAAYEQPRESTHYPNLDTRWKEDQRAAEGDMEKNCRRRETEDGFHHLERSCYRYKKQSRLEETSQWPYSPRGELGNKSSKQYIQGHCYISRIVLDLGSCFAKIFRSCSFCNIWLAVYLQE